MGSEDKGTPANPTENVKGGDRPTPFEPTHSSSGAAADQKAKSRFDGRSLFDQSSPAAQGTATNASAGPGPSQFQPTASDEQGAMSGKKSQQVMFEFRGKDSSAESISVRDFSQLAASLAALLQQTRVENHFHGNTVYAEHAHGSVGQSIGAASNSTGTSESPALNWPASAFAACANDAHALAFLVASAVLEHESVISISHHASVLSATMIKRRVNLSRRSQTGAGIEADIDPRRDISQKFEPFALQAYTGSDGTQRLQFSVEDARSSIVSHAVAYLGSVYCWREDFSDWLKNLASHSSLSIRHKAGAAAAILADLSGSIDLDLIHHWLTRPTGEACDAVDACFAVLLKSAPCRAEAEKMLRAWAQGENSVPDDAWYAVFHLCGHLVGAATPKFAYGLLRSMLQDRNGTNVEAREKWALRGIARTLWLSLQSPDLLSAAIANLSECISDATRERDWLLRAQIYNSALFAVYSGLEDTSSNNLTAFETALLDPESRQLLSGFLQRAASIGMGVNIRWRELLRELFHRAKARAREFEVEPTWLFCRDIYFGLVQEADKQTWRLRVSDWVAVARAEGKLNSGAEKLLVLINSHVG